jgi:lipid II:glycine glycyltransferase (peptidoglycan interpeptide bridge formation enzyme)
VARHEGEPVAAALIIAYRGTAHLSMIPSSRRHPKLPASHLLVWEAMRWAKAQGCTTFDVDGYSMMARPGDNLWGVNEFKRGFAPREQVSKCVAIHERVFSPAIVASAAALRRLQSRRRKKASDDSQ